MPLPDAFRNCGIARKPWRHHGEAHRRPQPPASYLPGVMLSPAAVPNRPIRIRSRVFSFSDVYIYIYDGRKSTFLQAFPPGYARAENPCSRELVPPVIRE